MILGAYRLKKDIIYKNMYAITVAQFGEKEADWLWEKAAYRYEDMILAHKEDSFLKKMYTHTTIYRGIAIYGILYKKHPEQAMQIMEMGMFNAGTIRGKRTQKLLKHWYGKWIFMRLQEFRFRYLYTDICDFSQGDFHIGSHKKKMKVDIYQCLFHEVCVAEGFRELSHIFCDYETYYYSKIPQIHFHRTSTIGNGGKRCDYYIGRKD